MHGAVHPALGSAHTVKGKTGVPLPLVLPAIVTASWNKPAHDPDAGYVPTTLPTNCDNTRDDVADDVPYTHVSRVNVVPVST